MENSLKNFKMSAIIGFLIILPFMILNFIFDISKRLDTYNLRNVTDVVIVFGLLWLGLTVIALMLMPILQNVKAGSKIAEVSRKQNISTNPNSAAIISLVLAFPFATMFLLLFFQIEPPFASLLYSDPDKPNFLSLFVVLGVLFLTIAAGFIARAPIVRTMQAGGSLFAHPLNLMITGVILTFIGAFVCALMIDQFPCWIGVPNCD